MSLPPLLLILLLESEEEIMPKGRPWLPGETPEEELMGGILGIIGAHPEAYGSTFDRGEWLAYLKEIGISDFFALRTADHIFGATHYYHAAGIRPPTPKMIARRTFTSRNIATGRFVSYAESKRLLTGVRPDRASRLPW